MSGQSILDSLQPKQLVTIAYVGVALGAILTFLPFVTGASTLAACEFGGGLYSIIYDFVGIYPPAYTVRIAWSEMMVYWFDGCNGHVSSLWPSVIGAPLLVMGAALSYRLHR